MEDHKYTYPDLVSVEDWLNAKGYTGEAGACHQAMSLIRKQENQNQILKSALKKLCESVELAQQAGCINGWDFAITLPKAYEALKENK